MYRLGKATHKIYILATLIILSITRFGIGTAIAVLTLKGPSIELDIHDFKWLLTTAWVCGKRLPASHVAGHTEYPDCQATVVDVLLMSALCADLYRRRASVLPR